jgi:predicted cupin superfamily sugar epimerase
VSIGRARALIDALRLVPHPEGGWYREIFRSSREVLPRDGRPVRSALTTIDFLLQPGEFSAWHRVQSDEVWHLLEGGPLRLTLLSPSLDAIHEVELAAAGPDTAPRAVVPAGWWQAAEAQGNFAYVGATVGPGFDFNDFLFARDDAVVSDTIRRLRPDSLRLLGA